MFWQLRTVYYEMSEGNEKCHFDLLIDVHDRIKDTQGSWCIFALLRSVFYYILTTVKNIEFSV